LWRYLGYLFGVELLDRVKTDTKFDLLVPMPNRPVVLTKLRGLPKLRAENIAPRVPWLYGFQIDYCFR
jgi:hypothetical protein